ncbi:MAG: hypothetical protein A2214_00805 [Candidatus Harrisonbacteria bacterium RIFOXYA1_FULL_48_8]|uniref:DUF5667 domain-containing protein n=3 Tax=Parcubacteria group TaxID=1794811 RepID=A0A0G1T6I5_9BACT|nr:MAG: hypothetical protein UY02_C0003G0022 [Candidatus Giovannonibacteria bacterium GW2011_GWB1_47_6b]KKU95207.1 MAG: hypothetical protein UY24_C0002G0021 [Parcubacteria group bacterium GW2011_GWA1_48_11b]OGY63405.1 MAG: hypothetical protein A3E64_01705 [Candidatus Harrisonbacteria bacterium RIFCSPHIGHO2_12_FULL_48_16]OGY69034.1 MAG: hypothetical protein A2214_00805 [Candidatus Harrisonbacteria bacterium RIFOXYA1_FULL_48_8]
MKKLIFIIFVLLLLASASVTLAQTTLTVPIPGGPSQIANPAQYIRTVYQFSLGFGGLAAMGIIVFAAIKRIVSAGNVAQVGDANDMIKQAVIGLVLLFSAFLILYTINPNLVSLKLETLEGIVLDPVAGESFLNKINALNALAIQSNKAAGTAAALQVAANQVQAEADKSGDPLKIAKAELQVAEANVAAAEALAQWNTDLVNEAVYKCLHYDELGLSKTSTLTKDNYCDESDKAVKTQRDQLKQLAAAKETLVGARIKLTELQGGAIKIDNQTL